MRDFLVEWLGDHGYPTDTERHLLITDIEVTLKMREAEPNAELPGHRHACRINRREHFKQIYSRNPSDAQVNPEAGEAIFYALRAEFGAEHFRHDRYRQKGGAPDFPVRMQDNRIASSLLVSDILTKVPVVDIDYVFAYRSMVTKATRWLEQHREEAIKPHKEGNARG